MAVTRLHRGKLFEDLPPLGLGPPQDLELEQILLRNIRRCPGDGIGGSAVREPLGGRVEPDLGLFGEPEQEVEGQGRALRGTTPPTLSRKLGGEAVNLLVQRGDVLLRRSTVNLMCRKLRPIPVAALVVLELLLQLGVLRC